METTVAAAVPAGGALPPDAARFVWQARSHGWDIGMRSINLLKVAAEAELLRLRALLARQGRRAAFGVVAAIFVLGVLVLAEITGWQVLRLYVAPIPTTLILLGINFAIAAVFGVLAARSSPSHTEREALQVRRQALDAARGTLSFTAAVPVASTLLRLGRRRGGRRRSVFRLLR